jgi:hypothetical protein
MAHLLNHTNPCGRAARVQTCACVTIRDGGLYLADLRFQKFVRNNQCFHRVTRIPLHSHVTEIFFSINLFD